MSNQDALSENLESDPFTNLALQRLTCWLYFRFGSFPAPLSNELLTSRNYVSELGNKNGGMKKGNRSDGRTADNSE